VLLVAGADQLGERGQEALDADAAHVDELAANEHLAALREHGDREAHHPARTRVYAGPRGAEGEAQLDQDTENALGDNRVVF
jgi:hypothetical protein